MFDHLGLNVRDLARSRAFYAAALAPLGMTALVQHDDTVAFGNERPVLWLSQEAVAAHSSRVHIALAATTRLEVDTFHRAALAAGGTDNGAPGLRAQYHPDYYAAFVIDPDGHNVEAVCRRAG